jgi:hypothetical protein
MLHVYVEQKRARLRSRRGRDCAQAWTVEAYLTLSEVLFRAQPSRQRLDYRASAAVFAGVGMQH